MTDWATATEILQILQEQSAEVERRLPVHPVQLSMPTDGNGARIKVSVRSGLAPSIPSQLRLRFRGKELDVPLEAAEDFQDYSTLS